MTVDERIDVELKRETVIELQGLLEEADYWVRETLPSEWRLFSRVYDTRGAFLKASKQIQARLVKALQDTDQP